MIYMIYMIYKAKSITMLEKLLVSNFEWIKDSYQFNEDFNEEIDEGSFLEIDVQHLKKIHELHNDLLFLLERIKIKKLKSL